MQAELKVLLVQARLSWQDVDANLFHIEELLRKIPAADVVVLPEMFSTGFSMNTRLAESERGKSVTWMKKMAREKKGAVCGSVMIEEQGKFYNRLFWVDEKGELKRYDKRHLFSLSEEPKHFTAGKERLVVEYRGWKFCPLICYDLRFPVWSRNDTGYDVLIYVANWPEKRNLAWKTLLPARAVENQCYVVAVNRVGKDGNEIEHSGDSGVYDAMGYLLRGAKQHEEEVIEVRLRAAHLQEVRTKFPFLKDGDRFLIKE
jgi:predicted amidohydrolase